MYIVIVGLCHVRCLNKWVLLCLLLVLGTHTQEGCGIVCLSVYLHQQQHHSVKAKYLQLSFVDNMNFQKNLPFESYTTMLHVHV